MIPKANLVTPETASPASAAGFPPVFEAAGRVPRNLRAALARLGDKQLALLVSVALFAVGAWPLLLVEVPPLQDLPNHLATAVVMAERDAYPEYIFNGFAKTNAALFAWLHVTGGLLGFKLAGKIFALGCIAATALVLPRFVLEITGSRTKMLVASLFMWPMVHNWFVSMGMLDFALGVALSLGVLILLDRRRRAPTWGNALGITFAATLTWYAHCFALMVVHLLVLVHLTAGQPWPRGRAAWRARCAEALRLLWPLTLPAVLVLHSLFRHVTEPGGAMKGFVATFRTIAPWELVYNLWAEWLWGFSKLSISSVAVMLILPVLAYVRRRESPTFFSPWAVVVLGLLYLAMPYNMTHWFHVNSRFIPFLWVAMLLRVPERLPRPTMAVLGVSAAAYSLGMGIDYVRLDQERAQFTAGTSVVPERARLLPLVFRPKMASENTRNLLHAWGFYVLEKHTSAPLIFAHSNSFPITYKNPPTPRFHQFLLEGFAAGMSTHDAFCGGLAANGTVLDDCVGTYRGRWHEFWRDAMPRYEHVLLWQPPPEALALVPPQYTTTFERDGLVILQRGPLEGGEAVISAR